MSDPSEPLGFGTSGLRGPAEAFTPAQVGAWVGGFLRACCADGPSKALVGWDLRPSSPAIAALAGGALSAAGFAPVLAGPVPTPALAAYGIARGWPAIMVTGSHIPAQYNGLKFYTPRGEVLKTDETAIAAAAMDGPRTAAAPVPLSEIDPGIARFYGERYRSAFPPDTLAGMRVGLFAHSAVGRDLLGAILGDLGAQIVAFGRSDSFIAVDTEAVEAGHLHECASMIAEHGLDAVVSTDGDGDRPLVIDETGQQINGDVLGALTAHALGIDTLVTPLTSTTAIERSGWFETVIRTRIGSPHVIAAMAGATGETIAGFEANGGFLTASPVSCGGGTLPALPTRDAVLPIIAALGKARRQAMTLSRLAASLPPRSMRADRLERVPTDQGRALVEDLAGSRAHRAKLDPRLADPADIDLTDGVRFSLADGAIVHVRQSGNAPELRCYVETDSPARTQALLADMRAGLARLLDQKDRPR